MFTNKMTCPTLRMGDKGHDVVKLQELLYRERFYLGPIDGRFGCETERAVLALQRSEELTPTGVVDPDTWTVLGVNCNHIPQDICPSKQCHPRRCPANTFSHTIKLGDTLYAISIQYKTTVNAIMRINPNINPNELQVGQIICIPGGGRKIDPIISCDEHENLW